MRRVFSVGLLVFAFSNASSLNAQIDLYNAQLPLPVLFLHGMSGDASSWGSMASLMSEDAGLTEGENLNYCLNGKVWI